MVGCAGDPSQRIARIANGLPASNSIRHGTRNSLCNLILAMVH
jgi:hypothetical protein